MGEKFVEYSKTHSPVLEEELKAIGFSIEFCKFLDGKTNGAVEEPLHDERENI
jgi:hypothetical protein